MTERKAHKPMLKDIAPQKERGLVNRVTMTTNIEKDLLAEAKETAKENGIPLTRFLDAAIRNQLASMKKDNQMKMVL